MPLSWHPWSLACLRYRRGDGPGIDAKGRRRGLAELDLSGATASVPRRLLVGALAAVCQGTEPGLWSL